MAAPTFHNLVWEMQQAPPYCHNSLLIGMELLLTSSGLLLDSSDTVNSSITFPTLQVLEQLLRGLAFHLRSWPFGSPPV
jgi:hypothetical protein